MSARCNFPWTASADLAQWRAMCDRIDELTERKPYAEEYVKSLQEDLADAIQQGYIRNRPPKRPIWQQTQTGLYK